MNGKSGLTTVVGAAPASSLFVGATLLEVGDSLAPPNGSTPMSPARVRHQRNLAVAIRQRIEVRVSGRIRDLEVRVDEDDTILLSGSCSTYYSKQLAQHAAMGVIEDEHLENNIEVSPSA